MEIGRETAPEILNGKVVVGVSPTPLTLSDEIIMTKIDALKGVMILNNSESTIYIGGENVNSNQGFPIRPRQAFHLPISDPSTIYLVADDADADIRWVLA